jgi:Protein of unknown function (DUF1571)
MKRLVASLICSGLGFVALQAEEPIIPASFTPKPAEAKSPGVVKVEFTKPAMNGTEMLPKMLGETKAVLAKTRDYTGHMVRQERVGGRMSVEQVAELRVRMEPLAINVKTVKPLTLAGEETSYMASKSRLSVRFKPAGIEGVKGFQNLEATHAKALANTRHPANEIGLAAMVERVEKMLATEQSLKNPVQVFATDYTIGGKAVTRFEIITERQHTARYAHRVVMFIENDSKVPVRFEAYDAPKPGNPDGEMIEVQSYISLKTNVGLGDRDFER